MKHALPPFSPVLWRKPLNPADSRAISQILTDLAPQLLKRHEILAEFYQTLNWFLFFDRKTPLEKVMKEYRLDLFALTALDGLRAIIESKCLNDYEALDEYFEEEKKRLKITLEEFMKIKSESKAACP